tara:strand:- start:27150 stop:28985 length:1836 start_codon:yes stop_codon:yes gene_type:complete
MNNLESGKKLFKDKSRIASNSPGVYQILDDKNKVIYVGKAKNLPKRLQNYSTKSLLPIRTERMITASKNIELITTRNESEALLLEANLIKKFKPRYNVLLKDDKSFPYIQITNHKFPQLTKFRGKHNDKDIFFGPFASIASANWTIKMLQKVFQIRVCDDHTFKNRKRPCILHQIKRCAGPCTAEISEKEYSNLVNQCLDFLRGKSRQIQKKLSCDMDVASKNQNYEKAAILRDRIKSLTFIQSSQHISKKNFNNADLIVSYRKEGNTCISVSFFRSKQNWGSQFFYPSHENEDNETKVISSFITQFYENKEPPLEIITNIEPENKQLIIKAFNTKFKKKINLKTGKSNSMISNALKNARESLSNKLFHSKKNIGLLETLSETFKLQFVPNFIEVYDNSHFQGSDNTGALITFGEEGFIKNRYRKFNIKGKNIKGNDDYGMMKEVIKRRFSKIAKGNDNFIPDLLLIDGGKGQFSVVKNTLNELGFYGIKVIAMSKGKDRNKGNEKFILDGKIVSLRNNDPILFFLQRLRDEAHRFAITTHRKKRSKNISKSQLDLIDGIGRSRKKSLLNHFGSIKSIEGASLEEIEKVEGVNKSSALKIYNFFHKSKNLI